MEEIELPRRFALQRNVDVAGVSGTGVVALGVEFPDGKTIVRFIVGEHRQVAVWDSMDAVRAIHGHGGHTEVVWIDE